MESLTIICKNEDRIAVGKTKIERYGWSIPDHYGVLIHLYKDELHVDHTYQRDEHHKKALQIAKNWSWISCGTITVTQRNGKYFVMDGQTRVLAARKRTDITKLPCILFKTTNIMQEAQGFLDSNTARRNPTATARFKGQLVAQNKVALMVDELLHIAGRQVNSDKGAQSVRCISTLMINATKYPDSLTKLWPMIVKLTQGEQMYGDVIEGLLYIERNLPGEESLLDTRNLKRILAVGNLALFVATKKSRQFFDRGGAKNWATGILAALNKGCKIQITLTGEIES